MKFLLDTNNTMDIACQNLEKSIAQSDFGILHIHDMQQTMQEKGVELGEACRVYEICNPHLAKEILDIDMSANMLLPCRVSVYTQEGITKIGMINPTQLMKSSEHSDSLMPSALLVEEKLQKIIHNSI